jgi:hypothetical protein
VAHPAFPNQKAVRDVRLFHKQPTRSSPEFGSLFMIMRRQFYGLRSLSSFSSNPIQLSGLGGFATNLRIGLSDGARVCISRTKSSECAWNRTIQVTF